MDTTPGARTELLRLAEALSGARRALGAADEAGVWQGRAAARFHEQVERHAASVARLARVAEAAAPLVLAHSREIDAAAATPVGPAGAQ